MLALLKYLIIFLQWRQKQLPTFILERLFQLNSSVNLVY